MAVEDEIARLAQLRAAGVLTDAEFEAQRVRLLAHAGGHGSATDPAAPHLRAPGSDPGLPSIGAYDLVERVGEGAMGRVYRGRHRTAAIATRQGGDVAVKVLHDHLASKPGFVDRFRHEAEALAALQHPNIVRVVDMVEDGGRFAIVMEWVPGRPLSAMIGQETGPLPWDRAQRYVWPLLDAVEHAHQRGVIHRDLKPDNIRVTPDDQVKVVDFGIARVGEGRGRTKTGTGLGTVDYTAPEQFNDAKTVDARADVYALGLTLYEMVAGRLPWEPTDTEFGVMQKKDAGALPPPTTFYPAIPPRVVQAIMDAVKADPARRTPSVAALREALVERRTEAPVSRPPSSGAGPIAVVLIAGLALLALGIFVVGEGERARLDRELSGVRSELASANDRIATLEGEVSTHAATASYAERSRATASTELTECRDDLKAVHASLGSAWGPSTTGFKWHFESRVGSRLNVRIWSQSRSGYSWPGPTDAYILDTTLDVTIGCARGEKVCFAAWDPRDNGYWGVGQQGTASCERCCYTCEDAEARETLVP